MANYDLYYWPVPFRGQFIRAILAYAGKSWVEHDSEAISALMAMAPSDQPMAFMGPPLLIDNVSGLALAQMPAIALYLGDSLGLVGGDGGTRAKALKVVNDANDVIDELTLDGGREMWTYKSWVAFVPRLKKWMEIWEALAIANQVNESKNYLLGTAEPSLADIVTATLWGTMGDRFVVLQAMLAEAAPKTAELVQRMQALPSLARLRETSFEKYGNSYCGGRIEESLRAVIAK